MPAPTPARTPARTPPATGPDRTDAPPPAGPSADQDAALTEAVTRWFARHARPLPWRRDPRDPWLTLMSEVMLQQTQAARVAERFERFARRYPTPQAMARLGLADVLARWSGLGYYRRARLLHECACAIVQRHGGTVPSDPAALADLPGIGRYTAGAVLAIAFGLPQPLVDGNVMRVLLRLHGDDRPPERPEVRRWAWSRAEALACAARDVAAFSEGLMELGATVCTPRSPACLRCPLADRCRARAMHATDRIPRPRTRPARSALALTAVVVHDEQGRVLLERRPAQGLWAGLWQPPCVEHTGTTPIGRLRALHALGLAQAVAVRPPSAAFTFATTHRQGVRTGLEGLGQGPRQGPERPAEAGRLGVVVHPGRPRLAGPGFGPAQDARGDPATIGEQRRAAAWAHTVSR
ncbi:MAG: A/G-specific adenine glycosylase [Phycisphaerales bacterium]|nr:MAG: A/G-specific adenine glycosylase [Phycisphaerales bacterium]